MNRKVFFWGGGILVVFFPLGIYMQNNCHPGACRVLNSAKGINLGAFKTVVSGDLVNMRMCGWLGSMEACEILMKARGSCGN